MSSYLAEIGIVVVLLAINGCFALSEMAIVSSRRARLEALAEQGSRGARTALRLAEDPGRFLSSVQIGITLVGILAGAYSGATLAMPLQVWLESQAVATTVASPLSIALVVGSITYLSLIIGELVPKQIALSNPEKVASLIAGPMRIVAIVASPVVFVLDASSRFVLKLLRLEGVGDNTVTEEEIRAVIAEGTKTGILEPEEKELMAGVMRFGDRTVRALMTPRRDVVAIDLAWEPSRVIDLLARSSHSRYPVYAGTVDDVQGIVQAKDLLDLQLSGGSVDIAAAMKPVEVVPDTASALDVLALLRRSPVHIVVVVDEYGSVEGIVTAADVLSAIVGDFAADVRVEGRAIIRRQDGTWLLDADLPVDLVAEELHCKALDDPDRDYETLAGFVLAVSKTIPSTGDVISWRDWTFEIVDMDGRRIDKVLATAPSTTPS